MTRTGFIVVGLAGFVLLGAGLLVYDSDTSPSGSGVVLAVLGLLVAVSVAVLVRDLSRSFGAVDPMADAISTRLGAGPEQRTLITRWLRRSRRYRNIGGATGVAAGLLIGGLGGMILLGLTGVTIGSLAAEAHLLAPDLEDRPRRRTAALDRRRLADYWAPARQVVMAVVALVAAVVVAGHYLGRLESATGGDWAVASLLLLVVAAGLQWRVATRRRPALPSTLRFSDDLVRRLAITNGIAIPATALALALVGQSLWNDYPMVSAICWLVAIAQFWSHRGLGLDNLSRQPHLDDRSDDRGAMA